MALIRIRGHRHNPAQAQEDEDLILNTVQIAYATGSEKSDRSVVFMGNGISLNIALPFDHLWTLIQRET